MWLQLIFITRLVRTYPAQPGDGDVSGQAEPPDATTGWRSGGSGSRDPVSAAPGCWDSRLLRPKECKDLMWRIDSKDAGSGADSDIREKTGNLREPFAAGVKAEDIVGRVNGPHAIPARRDSTDYSHYLAEAMPSEAPIQMR